MVQRALLFRGEGSRSRPRRSPSRTRAPPPARGGDDSTLYLSRPALEDIEREAIRLSLRRNGGRRSAVVRELRIAKSTVLKRITQWGLQDEGRAPGGSDAAEEDGNE